MEKRKSILGCVVLIISSLLITESGAQNCDSMVNITSANTGQRVQVNRVSGTGSVCLRCMDASGQIDTNTVWSLEDGSTVSNNENVPNVAEFDNGVLVLLPGVLGNGLTGEYGPISCFGTVNFMVTKLYSSVLLDPSIPSASVVRRAGEGSGVAVLVCNNPNSREVSTGVQWFRASDRNTVLSILPGFSFINPNRTSAGEYICEVASLIDGQTATSTAELIVEYAPEITLLHGPNIPVFLNRTLELTCNYNGVPIASFVEWFVNETMCLNCTGDPRISVSITEDRSVLMIENVRRNEGGLYSCMLGNVRGSSTRNVTTILILNPPEPVDSLTVGVVGERTIPLSWDIVFDGGSPITEAMVSYSIAGQAEQSVTIPGSTPTSVTLMDLLPFMTYNITVFLINAVGISPPMSVTADTLSLVLGAPTITSFTADSSTMLTVNWMPSPYLGTTENSSDWTVEIERISGSGMEPMSPQVFDAADRTASFSNLAKGTIHQIRIRGSNSRGPGNFSDYMSVQTIVDEPSVPQGITLETINSFALNVTWMAPSDSGGRPISQYFITVMEEGGSELLANLTASSDTFNLILRSPNVILVNSTTYEVRVAAQNTMGLVSIDASISGTTEDIEQPQQQLNPLTPLMASNRTIQLTWEFPGGFVDEYIIEYNSLSSPENVLSVQVNGTETSFVLTGLDTGTTYRVVIITVNALGMSSPNPAAQFTTLDPDDPVVVGPDPVTEGDIVILRCTSPDNRPIMWSREDETPIDDMLVFMVMGTMNNSTLTINDVRVGNAGVYVCRVGQATARHMLTVLERTATPTTEMPGEGIGTTTIIIAACVGGGGALLILLLLGVIILCCCCTKGDRKNQYSTKPPKASKATKADKRTNELFEHSTAVSYAHVDPSGGQRDTGVSFDMPDAFQGHSSFNTLDKPAKRSSSPEATAQTSSFGVTTASGADKASPPRYQDMPPSYDGTLL